MAEKKAKPRKRIYIILGVVAAIVIYGLAVERTGVSLDEITSETRQASLVRIIRSLAHPDLVTYDNEESKTDVEYFVPCQGLEIPVAEGAMIAVTPGCAEPGDQVTIDGSGFEPRAEGRLEFVPDSEFSVTRQLGRYTADADGNFTQIVEIPDRPTDNPQLVQAVITKRLGTWGNRVEVWTDSNENGVVDQGIIDADGFTITVAGVTTDIPAVALLDATREVVDFVTTGEPFIAIDGPAIGGGADPLEEDRDGTYVSAISGGAGAGAVEITISGEEGTDISAWRVAVYDGASGEVLDTASLGDQIELSPRVSETTHLTLEKIVDTVFLALVATTAGLMVALPLSFVAARNLMKDVSTTVIGLGLGLIAVPLGFWLGMEYVGLQRSVLGEPIVNVGILTALLVVGGLIVFYLGRLILFGAENRSTSTRFFRGVAMIIGLAAGLEGLAGLMTAVGTALREPFGGFGFIPGLFATLGEIGTVILPFVIGLLAIMVPMGLATRSAYWLVANVPSRTRAVVGYLSMAISGAVVAALIGALINWLYEIENPTKTFWIPAAVGAVIGLYIANVGRRRGEVKIGLTIYYIARTIFNTLRSIEPLVMVIVFVVWVGFGEFAGSIALALHTAAALAKLYSEQVESIAEGPLEAVKATGATRLQSTMYAVVPQIVPPYIAFTMYRWDINVRMSTILGFAGGGGIGFLLQQNVQLGLYRAASVQMLAIAIVVASMDYASSRLRQRFT